MSIVSDNRIAELEAWREKAEAARAELEANIAALHAKLDAITRQTQEVRHGDRR